MGRPFTEKMKRLQNKILKTDTIKGLVRFEAVNMYTTMQHTPENPETITNCYFFKSGCYFEEDRDYGKFVVHWLLEEDGNLLIRPTTPRRNPTKLSVGQNCNSNIRLAEDWEILRLKLIYDLE